MERRQPKAMFLSIKEAVAYYGIGEAKMRKLAAAPRCSFSVRNGTKWLINTVLFEKWIAGQKTI